MISRPVANLPDLRAKTWEETAQMGGMCCAWLWHVGGRAWARVERESDGFFGRGLTCSTECQNIHTNLKQWFRFNGGDGLLGTVDGARLLGIAGKI